MGLIKEFKEFAVKGNFVDLAVGVVIGAASANVVKALVDRIIMPPVGLVTGRVNFNDLKVVLQDARIENGKEITKEVALGYGAAIQSFFEFLIIGFVVFLIVRGYNRFRHQAAPDPTPQEKLLTEIRDLLKEQQGKPANKT